MFLLIAVLAFVVPGSVAEAPASAEVCGRCHRAIHNAWRTSAHARAMESRVFQDALEIAEAEFGNAVRKKCLGCHAPVAVRTGDLALRQKVSWEGVTCDYCHSIQSVAFAGGNFRPKVEFSLVKTGPLKETGAGAGHGTAYSEVYTNAEACATCHEARTDQGFPILTTYTEWKNSRAGKEGRQCQSCHMYRVAGEVVDPRIQRGGLEKINLHEMPGSRSLEQLTRTIQLRMDVVRQATGLRVAVDVVNRNAGHAVPTGSSLRQLVLEVTADTSDGKKHRQERIYRRVLGDAAGVALEREHFAMVRAAKVLSDTRLLPDEKRSEVFQFAAPAGPVRVKAAISYVYSPVPHTGARERLTFLTAQRFLQ